MRAAGFGAVFGAMISGLRFDVAVLGATLPPAILLFYLSAVTRRRAIRTTLVAYLALLSALLAFLALADLQYFQETGRHFTYEFLSYFGPSALPVVSGAFALHPWLSLFSVIGCLALAATTGLAVRRLVRFALARDGRLRWHYLVILPLWIILCFIGWRGAGRRIQGIGDSLISPNPYINALCMNPAYSVLSSARTGSARALRFFDDAQNIRVTRELLRSGDQPPLSARYPLLHVSSGSPLGNRRNIVFFILESWSAKNIGCLGGDPKATPFFDSLARDGMLFTNFHATGIRTAEGIFCCLCSFPTMPIMPITSRAITYQTNWRSLSQILAEAGYQTIFVHGRDLGFDDMEAFLSHIRFQKIVDRYDFPAWRSPKNNSWPGFNDDEVVRRADQEFASVSDQPFFGVIYTMNTHEPFVTPPGEPLMYPPTTPTHRFLNALHYSDHTLEIFFELARTRPWFQNTIFIFAADHARMGDEGFTYDDRHRIPLLIYAPGLVPSARVDTVGSQLDILPTVLGLLDLSAAHAAWGRDLLRARPDEGLAVSIALDSARWHTRRYVLVDGLTETPPLLFDIVADPDCANDISARQAEVSRSLQDSLRSWVSLSQSLLLDNRVFPPPGSGW